VFDDRSFDESRDELLSDEELLACASGEAPGPVLMEMLLAVESGGAAAPRLRVEVAAAWARQLAWVQARAVRALAVAAGPAPRADRADDWVVAELAAALRLSPGSAQGRVRTARELLSRHAATLAAVEAGRICFDRARVIVEELGQLDDATAAGVEAGLLERAPGLTAGRLRGLAKRAVLVADPLLAERAHAAAAEDRCVSRELLGNGMGELRAFLPVDDLAVCWAAINAIATNPDVEDGRSADQRRADALVYLLSGGEVPSVSLVVHADIDSAGAVVAEATGCGVLPASLLERLIAGASIRLHTETPPEATPGYRPSAPLDRWVRERDRHCRFPGCPRIAAGGDIDHVTAYSAGGPTTARNLVCLCRHHHRLKHETDWGLAYDPDTKTTTWTSPHGTRYTDPPPF
jgi:hypothetical protein